jgi:hypothetical protein
MSLMYFRLYITQALLGYLFDLDSSNVNREINGRMLAVLSEVLPLPARDEPLLSDPLATQATASSSGKRKRKGKKIGTLEELLEKHPEFKEIFIDATEQELPRPKDKDRRKETSTVANARGTLPRCRCLARGTSSFCTFAGTCQDELATFCFLEPQG